jgi:hypothetical protein
LLDAIRELLVLGAARARGTPQLSIDHDRDGDRGSDSKLAFDFGSSAAGQPAHVIKSDGGTRLQYLGKHLG